MKKSVYRKAAEYLFNYFDCYTPGCCKAILKSGGKFYDGEFTYYFKPSNAGGWWMYDYTLNTIQNRDRRILALLLMEQITNDLKKK